MRRRSGLDLLLQVKAQLLIYAFAHINCSLDGKAVRRIWYVNSEAYCAVCNRCVLWRHATANYGAIRFAIDALLCAPYRVAACLDP